MNRSNRGFIQKPRAIPWRRRRKEIYRDPESIPGRELTESLGGSLKSLIILGCIFLYSRLVFMLQARYSLTRLTRCAREGAASRSTKHRGESNRSCSFRWTASARRVTILARSSWSWQPPTFLGTLTRPCADVWRREFISLYPRVMIRPPRSCSNIGWN